MYSTWTVEGQSETWPKILLAPELGRTVASRNRLIDHATDLINDLTNKRPGIKASTRPLIFVVHSLGGLVCKRALCQSRNNPNIHLRGIFEYTKGIIFMGTPHDGSWMASWAKFSAECIGLFKPTNTSLLKVLETEDQLLETTQVEFLWMIRELRQGKRRDNGKPIEVTCFYEEFPSKIVGKQIVSQECATFAGELALAIPANHSKMFKFASSDDRDSPGCLVNC